MSLREARSCTAGSWSTRGARLVFLVLALLGASLLYGQSSRGALTYEVETLAKGEKGTVVPLVKATYSNGLVALVKESHSSPIVTVDAWCSTGAACEKDAESGISHFFEHMFFKGTERHPRGEMDRIIKGLGGRNNAGTSVEYTHYYVTVPSENYLTALDVLSDALMNSLFEPEEVEREREVVKAEIRRKEDTPSSQVFVVFQKQFGPGTPYERPVLGYFETLDAINTRAFKDYLGEKYRAGNMAVVVTGDVNTEQVLAAIGRYFEQLPAGRSPYPGFEVPELKKNRIGVERRDINQGYMMFGFVTDGLRSSHENLTLDVAAAILGEGKSSRLHQGLVENEKLASHVEAWQWALRRAGVLGFEVTFEPGKEDAVVAAVLEELKALSTEGPSDAEVEKAKAMLRTSFAFQTETSAGKASTIGRAYTTGTLDDCLYYRERLDSVTPELVRAVVRKYTSSKHYAMGLVLPDEESGSAGASGH
ncbi:MAG: insulinase family protein [Candidatus Eiseniibacteriota bacterium]|nr:MAG: insulinase family protein [Candidatus Eisenbacteria bacterium]